MKQLLTLNVFNYKLLEFLFSFNNMGCLLSSPPATPRIFTYAKQEETPKSVGIKKVDGNFLKKPKPPRSSTNANTSLT